jgi:hypothetical protein
MVVAFVSSATRPPIEAAYIVSPIGRPPQGQPGHLDRDVEGLAEGYQLLPKTLANLYGRQPERMFAFLRPEA